MKKSLALAITITALLLTATVIYAQQDPPPAMFQPNPPPEANVPALVDVIKLISAGLVGGIISFLFEHFKFFHNLTSEQRWWLILSLSIGLPLLAQVALQFVPSEVWVTLEPYWRSIALGFVAWLGSQLMHKRFNADTKIKHLLRNEPIGHTRPKGA